MRKHIIAFFTLLIYTGTMHISGQDHIRLNFNNKGEFKIAQFTGLHWSKNKSG